MLVAREEGEEGWEGRRDGMVKEKKMEEGRRKGDYDPICWGLKEEGAKDGKGEGMG